MNTKYSKRFLYIFITFLSLVPSAEAINVNTEAEQTQISEGMQIILDFFTLKTLLTILLAIFALLVTYLINKWISHRLEKMFNSEEAEQDPTKMGIYGVLSRSVSIAVWSMGFMAVFTILGVNVGFFLGGIGIGLGFTMQIFLSNFIFGVMMVVQGTLRNGDTVELNGELMVVEKVHPLFTEVRKLDGVKKFTPNIKFLQDSFSNITLNESRRVEIEFTLDYTTDTAKVKAILGKVVQTVPGIMLSPEYQVWFEDLADNGMNVKLLFWIGSKEPYFVTRSNVVETLNVAFRQAKISVAFPQIALTPRQGEASIGRYQ